MKQIRKFQGTFLDKRAYDTCVGIFETYEIPCLPVDSQTRPATTSIPPAVSLESSSRRPRPASAQDVMSRPVIPLTGHSGSQQKMSNMQTSNNSQTAAILARSALSQLRQPNDLRSQPPGQYASSSRHTPTSQPAYSNQSQLWQPDNSQPKTSSQNPSSSRHTPTSQRARSHLSQLSQLDHSQLQSSSQNLSSSRHTPSSQPLQMPFSSPPLACLPQMWQRGDLQPVMPNQQASSSRHASESQEICVPSSVQPPRGLSQRSDRAFRNSQTELDKATDVPLVDDCSMVMDSMASSQANDGLNTQYPPPSSQLNYMPTSDFGFNSSAAMIQSPEKKASGRHAQSAPDTPRLPLPIVSSDILHKFAPRFTKHQLPTSEVSYQPTKPPEEIPEGLVAGFPVTKTIEEQRLKEIRSASQLTGDELAQDVTDKAQGDQKRALQATQSKKAKRVPKRTRAAIQAKGADPSRSKIVTLKIGRSEKNSNQVVSSSAPQVVPFKRSRTYLEDASMTDASSSHSSPTLPPKPAHVQDSGDRRENGNAHNSVNGQPESNRRPGPNEQLEPYGQPEVNVQPGPTVQPEINGQSEPNEQPGPNRQPEFNGQQRPNGQPEPNTEDHTQAARSLNDIHLSLDAFLSKNHQLLAPEPPPNPFNTFKEQMAHFGALPKEERTRFVNKLITEALVDPNFEKLCQEVEGSWKRFPFEK